MVTTGDIIQLLPDHVANQIAAGEVVQRPASVVKELLENSVDAGADEISLIVKDAGRSLIQVVDDGNGMSVTDLRLAFERHATSKIRSTEDIFHIQTKGFRGEALPSIAAVAQIDAVSKKEDEEVGNQLLIEGNEVKDSVPIATVTGTSISVKNLFFNVPARRNFLKSNQVELRHIQEEFLRVALAHPQINFRFVSNDADVYVLPKGNLRQRLVQVFGRKMDANLVTVSEETEIVKVEGYVGKPEAAKKQRGEQYFFVNKRFIRSPYLNKAIVEAFENLLPNQYFPSYFLYLEIDPTKIDINIHPTKTEIKFEEEYAIYAVLRSAVKHALGQFNISPSLDFEQNPDWAFVPSKPKDEPVRAPQVQVDRNYNPFAPVQPTSGQIRQTQDFYKGISDSLIESHPSEVLIGREKFETTNYEVIQWQSKYLITQHDGELVIIDQNRAHQTVLYAKLQRQETGNTLSQRLLFPIELSFSDSEIRNLESIENDLVRFGFDIEFQKENILINALPSDVAAEKANSIFTDFLSELDWHDKVDFNTGITQVMAKNMAIKKGESIQPEQAVNLVNQLFKLKEPNYSPFGKPVFVQIGESEIMKKLS